MSEKETRIRRYLQNVAPDGVVRVPVETMATELGYARADIINELNKLEARGEIAVETGGEKPRRTPGIDVR